jgi:hypothetical protein
MVSVPGALVVRLCGAKRPVQPRYKNLINITLNYRKVTDSAPLPDFTSVRETISGVRTRIGATSRLMGVYFIFPKRFA